MAEPRKERKQTVFDMLGVSSEEEAIAKIAQLANARTVVVTVTMNQDGSVELSTVGQPPIGLVEATLERALRAIIRAQVKSELEKPKGGEEPL